MNIGMKQSQRLTSTVIHLVLAVVAFIMVIPFVWMVLTAFKTISESTSVNPFVIFPSSWKWDHFVTVWNSYNFLVLYKNTLLMIFFRVLCAVVTASMAGYAFGRLKFPGKRFLYALVLIQMMVPGQIFVIPQYVMMSKLGTLNTMFALVFPGMVTAFGTMLMRTSFQSLPDSLEEAAAVDGCNFFYRFLFILAPLTRSAMVSLGIFTAVFAFKDLMWPMLVCPNASTTTLSAALAKLQGQYASNYPELMAAAVMACLPMIVIYLLFQRQFVQGIATTGGKL